MAEGAYDYGRAGVVGLGTPQANPTVEAEFRILLPERMRFHTVRLTSQDPAPRQRLIEYLKELPTALRRFDVLRPDIFAFACTASAYFVGPDREVKWMADMENEFFPVLTATQAIYRSLKAINAKKIRIFAPYPDDLRTAAFAYWSARGFDVVEIVQIVTDDVDTRSIYRLSSQDALAALTPDKLEGVDAIVLSGTGMPSLQALLKPWPLPVLSSNYCLAEHVLKDMGAQLPDWKARLAAAL